jgi:hypothetical protein
MNCAFVVALGQNSGKEVKIGRSLSMDLSAPVAHGKQRILVGKRKIRVSLDEFSQRFISGPNLPSGEDLDEAVKRVLGLAPPPYGR